MKSNPDYISDFNAGVSRGGKTRGAKYKHRYIKMQCESCTNDHVYIDRWHTILSFKCMRRECKHEWFKKRWEPTPDGLRDTYIDYVGQAAVDIEDEQRRLRNL